MYILSVDITVANQLAYALDQADLGIKETESAMTSVVIIQPLRALAIC